MTVLLIVLALLTAFALAAHRWGVDTRDGRDWQPGWLTPGPFTGGAHRG